MGATDLWTDLLGCLDLRELPAQEAADCFEGRSQSLGYPRLFGGQVLGQAVRAAGLACPGKAVKSLHVLFPREGRSGEPVRYEVTRQHEGGTFAALSLLARQGGRVIAVASASLHGAEDGREHQAVEPVPPLPGAEHRVELGLLPWETRSEADLDAREAAAPEYSLWMRTPAAPDGLAAALLAYATDLTLIGTAVRPLAGLSQLDAHAAFASAVTSHTLWFHRPVRTDGWLMLRQHSPVLAHGRCFGRGDVLTQDGTLAASYAQEALLRLPR